jgi:hypothetical protein
MLLTLVRQMFSAPSRPFGIQDGVDYYSALAPCQGFGVKRQAVAAMPATVADATVLVGYTAGVAGGVLTLPSAVAVGPGSLLIFKDEAGDLAAGTVTLTPVGAELVDGGANRALTGSGVKALLYSDGADWFSLI